MSLEFTQAFRDRIKDDLERQGFPPDVASAVSKAIFGRCWIGTNSILVYPYRKLLNPCENAPCIGLFSALRSNVENVLVGRTLSKRDPSRYTVYRHTFNGLFYVLRTVKKNGGAGPVLMGCPVGVNGGSKSDSKKGEPAHVVLSGEALRVMISIGIPSLLTGPPRIYPAGTLVQQAFQLQPWELAEWLESRGCPHPLLLKLALRQSVPSSDVVKVDEDTPQKSDNSIVFHGDKRYSIGGSRTLVVTENEDQVLQSFLDRPELDTEGLVDLAGFERAPRVLTNLRKKYGGVFASAIICPGKKGMGGYRVSIRRNLDQ